MKVRLPTIQVDDRQRRIIAWYYDRTLPARLATREEIVQWHVQHGESLWDDAAFEYDAAIAEAGGDA